MSNLSERQFPRYFHGTRSSFEPGQEIGEPDGPPISMTTVRDDALGWAKSVDVDPDGSHPRVYEIEPLSEIGPDVGWDDGNSFVTSQGRIKRLVGEETRPGWERWLDDDD